MLQLILVVLGAILGAVPTWYFAKRYYKKSTEDLAALSGLMMREYLKQNYLGIIDVILKSDARDDWLSMSPGSIGKEKWVSYKADVRIHFRTSFEIQSTDFREEWANRHPSREAVGYWYFLYFADVPIYEFIIVSVDGGKAHIPAPRTHDGKITPLDYKVAQILGYSDRLDEYINRSGLEVAEHAPL